MRGEFGNSIFKFFLIGRRATDYEEVRRQRITIIVVVRDDDNNKHTKMPSAFNMFVGLKDIRK